MKSTMIAKVEKRIMAVMLSLLLVVGVFAGVKLDVRAADEYTAGINLHAGDFVKVGDKIIIPAPRGYRSHSLIVCYYELEYKSPHHADVSKKIYTKEVNTTVPPFNDNGKDYTYYKVVECELNQDKNHNWTWRILFLPVDEEEVISATSTDKINLETQGHTCNFQWVTTIDPQAGADGLEEYKCVYCGAVQESHSIPAGVATVKDFYGKVKDAPANGTVTYDSGKLYTISDYLLKKLSERSDVTLTVNFEYQNVKYELTFPAGTDFTPVLTDEETMYGYFGVAAKLGLTVAAK